MDDAGKRRVFQPFFPSEILREVMASFLRTRVVFFAFFFAAALFLPSFSQQFLSLGKRVEKHHAMNELRVSSKLWWSPARVQSKPN